ncbi:MAG: glutaminase [Gammaproteobacteria bacterium]
MYLADHLDYELAKVGSTLKVLDYQLILEEITEEIQPLRGKGAVADYIPALKKVLADKFGIAIATLNNETYIIGDSNIPFSIQSISKLFTLSMVFANIGKALWSRVGVEPSGNSFNSLVQLEAENGIPRNPFINAGALVTTDCLVSNYEEPLESILKFVREIANNPTINYDFCIANSEKKAGYRNAALINFMKSFGNIENNVDKVLDVYFHQCSIKMSCEDLARACLYLANAGIEPITRRRILTSSQTKRVNAIMQTCGLYNDSGEFTFRVGLPGKSGVGGGIVAIIPNLLAICVWSPSLNAHGNSLIGMKVLELFTTKTGISIF